MKTYKILTCLLLATALMSACDRRDEDLVEPLLPENFPTVIVLSDEGDGDLEDSDELGIDLEILPVWDPVTRDPEGRIPTLTQERRMFFEIYDPKGFTDLAQYITGGSAVYEIDDCTDSSDEDIDLGFTFDASTGEGSFLWPADVAELELVLELNPDLFNDDVLNAEPRGFSFRLTGVDGDAGVRVNRDLEFEYLVLDDEAVFGDWELNASDPEQFAAFLALFGPLNADLLEITAELVDKIEISFGFESMEIVVALLETEEDECEPGEFENIEIEVEAEYGFGPDDLLGTLEADVEFEGTYEVEGVELEFVLEGNFTIAKAGSTLVLTLAGETDDDNIEEQTLTLTR